MKKDGRHVGRVTFFVVALVVLVEMGAGAQDGERSSRNRISADFTMERSLSALSDKISSKGRLFIGGRGLLRWETASPVKSVLVINRGTAWIHYPDLKVVKSFDIGTDPVMKILSEHLEALTSGSLDVLEKLYEVQELDGGIKRLTPKEPDVRRIFRGIDVALAQNGAVSRVVMTSKNGDVTTISFHNVRFQKQMQDSLFQQPRI